MKFTKIMAALALMSAVMPVAALQRMSDAELAQVRGREGVTILADLKVQIGSLTRFSPLAQTLYKLNELLISGLFGARVDVISESMYVASLSDSLKSYGIKDADITSIMASVGPSIGAVSGPDVVQIAFPSLPTAARGAALTISVASANTGAAGASMGGVILKDINPAGTKIWLVGRSR